MIFVGVPIDLRIDVSNRFIKRILDAESEAIMVLGSRKAESAARKANLEEYENKRYRAHLSPNGSFPNSYVFTPIENWSNDNVWQYLLQFSNPWDHSNKDLMAMYSGASADGDVRWFSIILLQAVATVVWMLGLYI